MHYILYDTGQYLFDRVLNGFRIICKLLFKGMVYFPMLFIGYIIAIKCLTKQDNGMSWVLVILLVAFLLYLFVFFLKGMLIACRSRKNILWIPLLFLCVFYTCIAPLCLAFETIEKWMSHISKENGPALTWLCCFTFGYYLYSRYHFLTDIAPAFVLPVYRAGIYFGRFLSKV